jgi:hypothetical protein
VEPARQHPDTSDANLVTLLINFRTPVTQNS